MLDRCLDAFDAWFCSRRGVYQTFGLTLLVVLAERLFPGADPHGFWLLYWLTVYSAVTQPALAYTSHQAARRLEAIQQQLAQSVAGEEHDLEHITEILDDLG